MSLFRRYRDRDSRDDIRTAVVLARLELVTERFEEAADRFETVLDRMEADE